MDLTFNQAEHFDQHLVHIAKIVKLLANLEAHLGALLQQLLQFILECKLADGLHNRFHLVNQEGLRPKPNRLFDRLLQSIYIDILNPLLIPKLLILYLQLLQLFRHDRVLFLYNQFQFKLCYPLLMQLLAILKLLLQSCYFECVKLCGLNLSHSRFQPLQSFSIVPDLLVQLFLNFLLCIELLVQLSVLGLQLEVLLSKLGAVVAF